MRSARLAATAVLLSVYWLTTSFVAAQQATVTTPYNSVGDSFFESFGTNWGFNWGNGFFNFGGPNMATPPFGGFDPNAGINGGFHFRRNGLNGFFNFRAAQGYRQNFVSQAPSVTLTNGHPGFISDTSQSPFVMGYIPVVGGFPTVGYLNPPMIPQAYSTPPVNHRIEAMRQKMAQAAQQPPAVRPRPRDADGDLNLVEQDAPAAAAGARRDPAAGPSSATQAVPSVAEARRLHAAEQTSGDNEAAVLLERGRTAEAAGKPGVAKIYYKMALVRATGELRDQIQARLDAVSSAGDP